MLKKIIRKISRYKENISKKEMLEILKTNDNVVLLDVRSSQEYKEGNLPRKHKYTSIWNTEKSKFRVEKQRWNNNCLL